MYMTQHKHTNKLINEKSPYLLQHAHNPVDWYPWGPEAFSRAVGEDKPIFLSVGYSTCHWCHVMERESFEDEEVAHILNKYFICIKVDREERPDIDSIYMSVCQALTGHGGWPLTVFLTPEKHPFYAGTYFSKGDNRGMIGLMSLLNTVHEAWQHKRDNLLDAAKEILEHQKSERGSQDTKISKEVIHDAFSHFKYSFDSTYGGFGRAPKFPTPHNLLFLLRYWHTYQEPYALEIVEHTLDSMRLGGIYDHVGFGFSRYSTDKKWLVPHFEKMLYDNALLALAYGEAFSATGKQHYADTAKEILTYILRDMTDAEGGFYSAEDADSEGVEGKFYVWTVQEIVSVLGEADGKEYCRLFDITPKGNFEEMNIPNLIPTGLLPQDKKEFAEICRQKLFTSREARIHPYKDDKVLSSWNGLMIAAMSYCGRVLGQQEYISAAKKCVDFIYAKLVRSDGRLLARYRDGEAAIPAYLEDYAYLVWGLLELYQANHDVTLLEKAMVLNDDMLRLFGENASAGLFLYGYDSEELITRPKESYDGAIPSGNSVAALNLLRLARLTGKNEFENKAEGIINFFSSDLESAPTAHSLMLCAYMYLISENSSEVVIVSSPTSGLAVVQEAEQENSLLTAYNKLYSPFSVSIADITPELKQLIPNISSYTPKEGEPTAYVCRNFSCMAPVTEVEKLNEILSH